MVRIPTGNTSARQVWPEDIRLILDEIRKEPVPEELLRLAKELQRALEKRLNEPGES